MRLNKPACPVYMLLLVRPAHTNQSIPSVEIVAERGLPQNMMSL